MAGFGENGGIPEYLADGVERVVFSSETPGVWLENTSGWTAEMTDWGNPHDQERIRARQAATGWRWLSGRAATEGPLVAGCLEVLDWLRGTEWWPPLDGAVLALETSEEAPPPIAVARFLRSLAASGELAHINALLFARPGGADLAVERHADYDAAILAVVRDEEGRTDLPVVTGLDFGHTDPMWTLPIGAAVHVDPGEREIAFVTAAVT